METLHAIIDASQRAFRARLEATEADGGLTLERYVRYLSMQFHLTRGVQRYFFLAASHPSISRARGLRRYLIEFAMTEEPHFQVAEADLRHLDRTPLPEPFDVALWKAYFLRRPSLMPRPFLQDRRGDRS